MSRMDRYYKNNVSTKRTSRNQDLYRNIYDEGEYSNIEGIANINSSNEVDIAKIKRMLKNYNETNNHELKRVINREIPKYEIDSEDDNRVYDIRDILDKAKSNKQVEPYYNLDKENVEYLRNTNSSKKTIKSNDDLEDMIDTITNTSKLNKLSDSELGLDLFSDLKSKENTIIESKDSIRSILEEAKKKEEKDDTSNTIDQSFFTSSLSFKEDDFEQITELKNSVNKNNKLIRILLIVISIIITIGIIIVIFFELK